MSSPLTCPDTLLEDLREIIAGRIPLSRAMQLEILDYDRGGLHARAPLEPNINDEATAFGGSQAALMTLVAWGVMWLETRRAGLDCDIVIHKGEIRWQRPLKVDMDIFCARPEPQAWRSFLHCYQRRGRAGLGLRVTTGEGELIASELNCRYVAIKKDK